MISEVAVKATVVLIDSKSKGTGEEGPRFEMLCIGMNGNSILADYPAPTTYYSDKSTEYMW